MFSGFVIGLQQNVKKLDMWWRKAMHIYLSSAQQFYKLLYRRSQNLNWNVTYIVYFF